MLPNDILWWLAAYSKINLDYNALQVAIQYSKTVSDRIEYFRLKILMQQFGPWRVHTSAELNTFERIVDNETWSILLDYYMEPLGFEVRNLLDFWYDMIRAQIHKAYLISSSHFDQEKITVVWAQKQLNKVVKSLDALKTMGCVSKMFYAECKPLQMQIVRAAKKCTVKSFVNMLADVQIRSQLTLGYQLRERLAAEEKKAV